MRQVGPLQEVLTVSKGHTTPAFGISQRYCFSFDFLLLRFQDVTFGTLQLMYTYSASIDASSDSPNAPQRRPPIPNRTPVPFSTTHTNLLMMPPHPPPTQAALQAGKPQRYYHLCAPLYSRRH